MIGCPTKRRVVHTKPSVSSRCSQCVVKSSEIDSLKSLCASKTSKIYQLERQIALLLKEKVAARGDGGEGYSNGVVSYDSVSPSMLMSYANVCCGTSDDILLSGSTSKCYGTDNHSEAVHQSRDDSLIRPFEMYNPGVFCQLSLDELDASTAYSQNFSSRSVAYYGDIPYSYTGGEHQANSISANPYLEKVVIPAVTAIYPWFCFNSIMVTKYINGSQSIPFHSDNEPSIVSQSSIMTISLGTTRNLIFQPKGGDPYMSESAVPLGHGDVLFMSRFSQDVYEHSVPKDFSKNTRISITFRKLIVSNNCSSMEINAESCNMSSLPSLTSSQPPISQQRENPGPPQSDSKNSSSAPKLGLNNVTSTLSKTLYISSSMFSHLDSKKLSSKTQEALVFSYPGATAKNMHYRFRSDSRVKEINPGSVDKIFLLCGTNDVDNIINSPKQLRNKVLYQSEQCNMERLANTCSEIEDFAHYLHGWASSAEIRILKVLPRESKARNEVINKINFYTKGLVDRFDWVKPCQIVKDRFLFANDLGYRKSVFFKTDGDDNVHLNKLGTARLANHLKFTAHNC